MTPTAAVYTAPFRTSKDESFSFMRSLASSLLSPSLSASPVWLEENEASVPMLEALSAPGPAPEHADKLSLFGQFVGSWDLEVTNYPEPEKPEIASGEWHFGWGLEGRAIIDVWISPRREERGNVRDLYGDYGATIRIFDPELDAWRSTWIGPRKAAVRAFVARRVGDEIVLTGSFKPETETRWIFSQIKRNSFHWRSVESSDGWKTFRLWQTMEASRR